MVALSRSNHVPAFHPKGVRAEQQSSLIIIFTAEVPDSLRWASIKANKLSTIRKLNDDLGIREADLVGAAASRSMAVDQRLAMLLEMIWANHRLTFECDSSKAQPIMDRSRHLPPAVKRFDEIITRIEYEGCLVHWHPL